MPPSAFSLFPSPPSGRGGSPAGFELDVVHDGADGDVAEQHGVAWANVHRTSAAGHQFRPDRDAARADDVGQGGGRGGGGAVRGLDSVLEQRDERGPIWIVLDALDSPLNGGGIIGVDPFEVDETVAALGPPSTMANRDHTLVVASTRLIQTNGQL